MVMQEKKKELSAEAQEAKKLVEAIALAFPNASAQAQHRLAVAKWFLDGAGLKGQERVELAKEWMAMPGWFGANDSAMRQALGMRGEQRQVDLSEYESL